MPAKAFVIRFPSGDFEYDMRRAVAPKVGETISKRGRLWRVTQVTQEQPPTVRVTPVDPPESK
jgi:hypothetical protein